MSEGEEGPLYPLRKEVRQPPKTFRGLIESLARVGHIYELSDFTADEREEIGLEPAPPTAFSRPEALQQLREVFRRTGLDKRMNISVKPKGG